MGKMKQKFTRVLLAGLLALSPVLYILIPLIIGVVAPIVAVVSQPFEVRADAVDLYWVGGTATWDATAGTKWATSSGGAGGHAIPTSTNKVIFDGGSGGVTVSFADGLNCADLVFTGTGDFAGTITGSGGRVYIYASMTMVAGMNVTGTQQFNFKSTATSKTITTAGKTLYLFTFDGVGGGWTFQDAVNLTGSITLMNGSVFTNAQTVTCTILSVNYTATRTFDMTNSTVNCNIWDAANITGLTLTTTGSTLNVGTSSTGYFYGGAQTYITVNLTSVGGAPFPITGANAYTTLTILNTAAGGAVSFAATQTVSGTLTMTGFGATTQRLCVYSSVGGTARTLTATVVAPNIDKTSISDMTGAGAGSWNISAQDNLDNGGNTGITFAGATDKTVYWVGGSGGVDNPGAHWSSTSGGAGGSGNGGKSTYNVVFDASSSGGIITQNNPWTHKSLDATNYTGKFNFVSGYTENCYGDITIGAGVDNASMLGITYLKTAGTQTVTSHGIGYYGFYMDSGGTYNLGDALNITGRNGGFTLSSGTFNTNNYAIDTWTQSGVNFSTTGASVKVLNMGSSVFTAHGVGGGFGMGTVDLSVATGLTFNPGTSQFIARPGYGAALYYTFNGGSQIFYDVTLEVNQATASTLSGAATFHDLAITGTNDSTVAKPVLNLANDQVVTNTFTATGFNATTRRLQICSNTLGTPRQITLTNNAVVSNTDFRDIAGTPSSKWDLSATNAGDKGGNYGITFTTPQNDYWVGNSGSWSDVNHWALTSGGTGGLGRVPLPGVDVAVFDSNSATYGPGAVTITMDTPDISTIDATAVLNTPIFSGTPVNVYGSLDLGTVTWTVTNTYFYSRSPSYIRSTSSLTNIYVDTTSGVCYLAGDIIATGAITLTSGILDLNGNDLTAATFDSSGASTRQLMLGEGLFTLNSAGAVTKWNVAASLTLTRESGTIVLTNSGVSAQTFAGAGKTYGNLYITGAGNYALSITGANTFADVTIDRSMSVAKTVKFPTSTTTIVSGLYIPVDAAHTVITLVGTTAPPTALVWTISKSGGAVVTDYLSLEDSTANGGALFYSGSHSTHVSHVTGWTNTDPTTPIVETASATNVIYNSASLNGDLLSIYPVSLGYAYFQVGTTTSYGWNTPEQLLTGVGTFTRAVTGLDYATTYHYRAAFRYNSTTYTYGSDATFTTQAAPPGTPVIITGIATNITKTNATLQGTLADLGLYTPVYVFFEYGTTGNYGYATAEITEISITSFSAVLTDLAPDSDYFYRAVARFSTSSYVYGSGSAFTTLSASAATDATTKLTIKDYPAVFSSYMNPGDLLFTVETIVKYPPYYPAQMAGEYFSVQVLGTDNSTLIASVPLSNWGDRPTAIYLNPTLSATLTPQAAYIIRLIGVNVVGTPNVTYTLTPSLWKGSDKEYLDRWCRGTAISMALADNVSAPTYLQVLTDRREVISDAAGGYFTTGIPGISQVRPYLFATHIIQPTVVTASGSSIYTNATAWETFVGAQAAADITAFGLPFGLSGRNAAAGMIFLIIIGVMLIIVKGTGGFGALGAFFIAIPVLWVGTYWQINEVQLLGVIVILCAAAFLASYIIPRL